MKYFELHCKSNFSFLEGASHPDEMVRQAIQLDYAGISLTDRNTLAGIIRGYAPAKDHSFPYIIGSELHLRDAPPMVVWCQSRAGYANLCRLLSMGRMRAEKGSCDLTLSDLESMNNGLIAGLFFEHEQKDQSSGKSGGNSQLLRQIGSIRDIFGDRLYLLAHVHLGVDDVGHLQWLRQLQQQTEVPRVAAGGAHYHAPERMLVHDLVTAIRNGTTIDAVHEQRLANSQYHLRSLKEIQRHYREEPQLIAATEELAGRCDFRLSQLRFQYPEGLAPEGVSPIDHLRRLTWEGANQRWPGGVPQKIIDGLRHEMRLIEDLRYEPYFLTVWDIVRFARENNILCQGRGSAANSMVCYCLGITNVDPSQNQLLFERFISRERNEEDR
ncbi:MAG: PHP domain-containing protein, partial [Planctomycetota bacterium]